MVAAVEEEFLAFLGAFMHYYRHVLGLSKTIGGALEIEAVGFAWSEVLDIEFGNDIDTVDPVSGENRGGLGGNRQHQGGGKGQLAHEQTPYVVEQRSLDIALSSVASARGGNRVLDPIPGS